MNESSNPLPAFSRGQVVMHRSGARYKILVSPEHGRLEADASPAYAYEAIEGESAGLVWFRSAAEMEDGRFTAATEPVSEQSVYRNDFRVNVYSEGGPLPDNLSLAEIDHEITDGDMIGWVDHLGWHRMNGEDVPDALRSIGNNGDFFGHVGDHSDKPVEFWRNGDGSVGGKVTRSVTCHSPAGYEFGKDEANHG